jgi:hypothetical protein
MKINYIGPYVIFLCTTYSTLVDSFPCSRSAVHKYLSHMVNNNI